MNHDPYDPPKSDVIPDRESYEGPLPDELPTSPLAPMAWYWLFFKPSLFFSSPRWLRKFPELVFVIWVGGAAYATEQINTRIIKAEMGQGNSVWESIEPWLLDSWINYWGAVLAYGAVSAIIIWYVAGWWYKVRLGWSGASNVEPQDARTIYVYQDLVQSGPALFVVMMLPFWFENYRAYWLADELISSSVLVFVFWSCVTSFKAARRIGARRWPALIWFLILPVTVYLLVLGALGAAYYWLVENPA